MGTGWSVGRRALYAALLLSFLFAVTAALVPSSRASGGKDAIDPNAVAALDRMAAFLRAQAALTVRGETTTDEVWPSKQKVQYSGVVELKVRRPDRMRADVSSDRKTRQVFYDGKTLTVFGSDVGYYASFPAPPTLKGLVDVAEEKYDMELPLADLFAWGSDEGSAARIKSAANLGESAIKGAPCDHYAFREEGVDWQVWIERGPRPLPRKLVITTTDEPTQPQYEVVLSWELGPRLDERMFTFVPPPSAHRIAFEVLNQKGKNTP